MSALFELPFESYETSVPRILKESGARSIFKTTTKILIKPNLVTDDPFPITTHPECVKAIVFWLQQHTEAELLIGEGCGDQSMETPEVFAKLGYEALSKETGVPLVDLNQAPLIRRENPNLSVFPEIYLPELAFSCAIFSVPVLKAHSLSKITGSLRNLIGMAPPEHYAGQYGIWKKALFHNRMHESIRDLNAYVTPHFTLMDASVGMAEYHLGGPTCQPPVQKLLAGPDALEVDRRAAELLGFDWQEIPHLA